MGQVERRATHRCNGLGRRALGDKGHRRAEPSAMSRLSAAIACCSLASPANDFVNADAIAFEQTLVHADVEWHGTRNDSGTALPTRSVSSASDGCTTHAQMSAAASRAIA